MLASRVARGAWVSFALVASVLPLSCGERAGDPVLALSGDQNLAGRGGGASTPDDSQGPTGLCGACTNSSECGDANDACIIRRQEAGFCGRDCDDQRGCPDGYDCVELNDDRLRQCVPRNACPSPKPVPTLTKVRARLLARINEARTALDQAPLVASSCLDDLAQASALDFARTDEALGKYVKECDPIWPSCQCGWSAEAEVAISSYDLDWEDAVDRAVESRGTEVDTHFERALKDDEIGAVGIGFWLSADEVWIALSFG
ncbi:MAG TPA: hypothetical protein VEQ58_17815 [Polyangiaceae bacterium]|nr:hypothetical protein [Polyangiaceae bacterium]